MADTNNYKLAVAAQASEGTYTTPSSVQRVEVFPTPSITPGRAERNISGNGFTPTAALATTKAGGFTAVMEVAGPSNNSPISAPPFETLLKGCGYAARAGGVFTVASTGGTGVKIDPGETYTQATTGATGQAILQYMDGDARVFVLPDVGSAAVNGTNVVTFSGGKTITPSAAAGGRVFWPVSQTIGSVAITGNTLIEIPAGTVITQLLASGKVAAGYVESTISSGTASITFIPIDGAEAFAAGSGNGDIVLEGTTDTVAAQANIGTPTLTQNAPLSAIVDADGQLYRYKGSRGTFTVTFTFDGIARFNFDFQGGSLTPTTGRLTGSAPNSQTPPIVVGSSFELSQVQSDNSIIRHEPCFENATIDRANTIALRACPSDPNLTGYSSARISGRPATVTMDLEQVSDSIFPFWSSLYNNTPYRSTYRVGSVAGGTGNTFVFGMWRCQPTDPGLGERNGIGIANITNSIEGVDNDELVIFQY